MATAEWAGDSIDRRVKTVSGETDVDDVEVAEPLLDSRGREVVASDLFDESEVPTKEKSDAQGKTAAKSSRSLESKSDLSGKKETLATQKPESVSLDDHPWAKESPAAEQSSERGKKKDAQKFAKTPLADISPDDLKDDPLEESSAAFQKSGSLKKDPLKSDQSTLEEAQQLEAKARVQSLLSQSKSLVNQGELRSAYRLAQQAERIADSEDLYFTAGEDQPADAVRAVLMKIRFEENKLAARKTSSGLAEVTELKNKTTKSGNQVSHAKKEFSNVPDGWSTASKPVEEDSSVFEAPEKTGGSNNPWAKSDFVAVAPRSMEIKPGPIPQTVRSIPAFPDTQDQWRGVANEPMSLGSKSSGIQASGFESSAQAAFQKTKVTHAAMPVPPAGTGVGSIPESAVGPLTVNSMQAPAPSDQIVTSEAFAKPANKVESQEQSEPVVKPVPGSLASTDDWRNQNLADIAVTRSPLLVAPPPPEEPSVAKNLAADLMDDSLGIDVQEPVPVKQSQSKLWLVFAAAAGACAMLFVRRRPARVARSAEPAK